VARNSKNLFKIQKSKFLEIFYAFHDNLLQSDRVVFVKNDPYPKLISILNTHRHIYIYIFINFVANHILQNYVPPTYTYIYMVNSRINNFVTSSQIYRSVQSEG
jgi:hypothetical protein